jgi:AcrR family transcriptional regulator
VADLRTEGKKAESSPPRRLRRTEAKAETRRRLLKAAEAAFRRDGYHATSLDRIAAEAGFTTGAVYSTFDSKADVMLALIAARATRRLEVMREVIAQDSDPEDLLAEFSHRYATQAVAERDWSATVVEFMVVVGRDEGLRARYAEHHDASREAIASAIRGVLEKTGTRMAMSPRQMATTMMSLNIGLTVESLLAPAEVTQDLYVDAQLALRRGTSVERKQR